eukprot:1213546-Prymnesium_polylepis.2
MRRAPILRIGVAVWVDAVLQQRDGASEPFRMACRPRRVAAAAPVLQVLTSHVVSCECALTGYEDAAHEHGT